VVLRKEQKAEVKQIQCSDRLACNFRKAPPEPILRLIFQSVGICLEYILISEDNILPVSGSPSDHFKPYAQK